MPARSPRAATRASSDGAGIVRRAMAEAELLRTLTEACEAAGLLWYHPPDPRKCSRCGNTERLIHQGGWPDLAIIQPPALRLWEAKTESGRAGEMQRQVLDGLLRCTELDVAVVRPRDLDACIATLLDGRVR